MAGGMIMIEMRTIEYLIFDDLVFANDLLDHHIHFYVQPSWLCTFFYNLAAIATLQPVDTWEELREQIHNCMIFMDAKLRTVKLSDVYVEQTPTNTWYDHITPRRARGQDASNQVLGHLRFLVTGARASPPSPSSRCLRPLYRLLTPIVPI